MPGVPDGGVCAFITGLGSYVVPDSLFECFGPVSAVGRPSVLTPETQYTLGASLRVTDNPEVGQVEVGVTYTCVDDVYVCFGRLTSTSANTGGSPGLMPAHEIVNAHINWKGIGGSPVGPYFLRHLQII
jgi:hypothetical protein